MTSNFDLREQIKRMNRIDLRRSDYESLLKRIRAITSDMRTIIGKAPGHETFFRARRNLSSKPNLVADLAAPPASRIIGFQRCNPPGVPAFYGASRRSTALLEIHAEVGDTVYLGQWMGREEIPYNRIFDETLNNDWKQIIDVKSQLLHTFFETLFTRRIHEEFSDDYKLTAAIAQHLMNDFPVGDFDIRADKCVALRYPSVADIEGSYNLAMPGDFATERLKLAHVMELKIDAITETSVSVAITDNAYEVDEMNIKWSGDPEAYPARRDGGVLFRHNGNVWLIALQSDGADLRWPVADMIKE